MLALAGGTLICAVAASLPVMLLGRAVQGAGGVVYPLEFGIVRDEFPRERIAGAIGLVSSLVGIGAGLGLVVPGTVILGLGLGLGLSSLANLIVAAVRQEQTGVATGMNTVMRSLGGAFGAQLAAPCITASDRGGLPTDHGFNLAFGARARARTASWPARDGPGYGAPRLGQ
jgi:hypothetical protein